jgi:hypothetical protein
VPRAERLTIGPAPDGEKQPIPGDRLTDLGSGRVIFFHEFRTVIIEFDIQLDRVTTRLQRRHWKVAVPPALPNPRVESMIMKS